MTKKQTIAEMLIETPITTEFKLWRWDMRIDKCIWVKDRFKLQISYDSENVMETLNLFSEWKTYMCYYFHSFEEAYEWMLAFLENVEEWKTFTYDVD